MTPAQLEKLADGDYVAYLGAFSPQGYKVTQVARTSIDVRIVVAGLYGPDWVLAAAFMPVASTRLTKVEIALFEKAKAELAAYRQLALDAEALGVDIPRCEECDKLVVPGAGALCPACAATYDAAIDEVLA